ncbi:MAG: hypothetical protein AB7S26_40565 [Sandaracinaceae bacterium]
MSDSFASPAPWHVTERLASLAGESTANGLRVWGIAVFYLIHVLNYRGLSLGSIELPRVEGIDESFHAMATALATAWLMLAAAVLLAIKNRVFPPVLKFVSTGADLVLLTSVLSLADGPRSPVLLVYFLVIALAGTRLSRRLVLFATGGSVLGYLFLLGQARLYRPALEVPPHWAITTVAALVLCGVVVTQILVRARRAADAYSALRHSEPPAGDDA